MDFKRRGFCVGYFVLMDKILGDVEWEIFKYWIEDRLMNSRGNLKEAVVADLQSKFPLTVQLFVRSYETMIAKIDQRVRLLEEHGPDSIALVPVSEQSIIDALEKAGYTKLNSLKMATSAEISRIKGFGPVTEKKIAKAIKLLDRSWDELGFDRPKQCRSRKLQPAFSI